MLTRRDPRSRAGGLTTHCQLHSKECERDRTNSPGLSLHGRPGGRSKWMVWRLRRIHPLGLGGSCASAWTSAAPHPQTNTQDTREALDPQHSTTSVQYIRTLCTGATARCVSAVSLKHARHAHAQVTRETHHTRCTQAAFLKSSQCVCPRLLRSSALLRLVGTLPARYGMQAGDARTISSVSSSVWVGAWFCCVLLGRGAGRAFDAPELPCGGTAGRGWTNACGCGFFRTVSYFSGSAATAILLGLTVFSGELIDGSRIHSCLFLSVFHSRYAPFTYFFGIFALLLSLVCASSLRGS